MWTLPHTDNTHPPRLLATKLQSTTSHEVSPCSLTRVPAVPLNSSPFFSLSIWEKKISVLSLHTGCAESETRKVERFRVASCWWANISKVGSGRCSYKSTVIPIHWPLVEMKQWIRQLLNSDPRKTIMINVCLIALTSSFFLYIRRCLLNVTFKGSGLVVIFLPSIYKAKHHLHPTNMLLTYWGMWLSNEHVFSPFSGALVLKLSHFPPPASPLNLYIHMTLKVIPPWSKTIW